MYTVSIRGQATKQLAALPKADRQRVAERIDSLRADPRPHGVEKLKGAGDLFRIRSGDYRVIYQIQDQVLTVLVITIGHRRDVYRGL